MRYYNENPQVIHWMSKCATLQQKLNVLAEKYKELFDESEKDTREYNDLVFKTKQFDSLPWYKKMFFKFKI